VERVIHTCDGKAEPLDIKIVNKDTLEILTLAGGWTPTTTRLRRVK